MVDWRTDRQIAEALFLSPRTVSWHVRSILAKLGATSRREVVSEVRAHGLPDA
jgi:DNA-binding CsgD family transcriptional regulator